MLFPIKDVAILYSEQKKTVSSTHWESDFIQAGPNEIMIDIDGIASFYITEGKKIHITSYPKAESEMVQDQLEKWGTVAILHQRQILNFHASSFGFEGKGVMVLGDTGAGKSSVTAAFCLDGAEFLNDDITAIRQARNEDQILKLGNNISLLTDAMKELAPQEKIDTDSFKHPLEITGQESKNSILNMLISLKIGNVDKPYWCELQGASKFALLRGNICHWEMLQGMPGVEEAYMKQLLRISNRVPLIEIIRPERIGILELKKFMQATIQENINHK